MPTTSKTTQDFVPIQEVRDGVIVLKDGSLRALIMVSTINFELKSDEERESTLYQFQNFLNGLDFSTQIFIQSRRLDIQPYLALLAERKEAQVNDLMKIQVQEYIEYIRNFTENTNIMTKNFFIVIPYATGAIQGTSKGGLSFLKKKKTEARDEKEKKSFEENVSQLEQRISVVEQGITRSGLRVARLGTQEIVELFYKIFNPGKVSSSMQKDDTKEK